MHRREFLIRSATGIGAAWLSSKTILDAIATQPLAAKFTAADTVTLLGLKKLSPILMVLVEANAGTATAATRPSAARVERAFFTGDLSGSGARRRGFRYRRRRLPGGP